MIVIFLFHLHHQPWRCSKLDYVKINISFFVEVDDFVQTLQQLWWCRVGMYRMVSAKNIVSDWSFFFFFTSIL